MKLLVLIAFMAAQTVYAKVSVLETRPIPLPRVPSNSWTMEDVSRIIPTNLEATGNGDIVAQKVGDFAITNYLNSPLVKNSSVGRTAQKVQDTMKTEMVLGGEEEGRVDHRFTFQILALQSVSRVQYKGWLNAELNFDGRAQQTNFEISEKVWKNKDFVISHTANHEQDLSSVGLRWNW
jgi:hypothetical protein